VLEPLFAEAKVWHGLRRFRLQGLVNVNIKGLLVAAGQNLKRFLAATGWGRRHALPDRARGGGALWTVSVMLEYGTIRSILCHRAIRAMVT
jgi:hypothetical protein